MGGGTHAWFELRMNSQLGLRRPILTPQVLPGIDLVAPFSFVAGSPATNQPIPTCQGRQLPPSRTSSGSSCHGAAAGPRPQGRWRSRSSC
jgi:hypothetical protein